MATGETKQITGSLTLEDHYQTTIYDDMLTISSANISLLDPAGEIFTDKGNDTVTVTDSTITNNSETEAELMFSMGSDNDSLTISNSTLNVNTFMGSGDDEVLVTGESQVTINKKFSLGSGNDILTISAILAGIGDIDFGDGINTLFFDGGKLVTTGTVSPLTNLSVTSQGGILAHNLTLSGTDMAISLSGNLTGDNSSRRITVGEGNVVLNTNSNIKTNVGFDLTNSIFTQSDSGSIELVNISGYAFVADSSSITLHDIIVNNTYGIKATDGTVSLNQVDFSNNRTGLLLDGTILNGKDISFTSNVNGALKVSGTDTVLEKAYFVKNYRNTYASAYGGAIATATATAYGEAISTASAYGEAISTASAYGGAIANISGNLTFRNGDNNFSDNSVNASATAAVSATATARATAAISATATATATAYGEAISTVSAYGGAIANTSGDLTFRSGANIFSGNNVNAYAKTLAYATAFAYAAIHQNAYQAYASVIARGEAIIAATAYGGAIANTSGNLTFSNGDNNFSDNSVNANVTATATATSSHRSNGCVASTTASACASAITTVYGGAIANTAGDLTFSESANHFSGNSVNASAFATASAEAHYAYDYAYVYASTTAYGGAIVNIAGDLTFSGSVNHFSGNSVDAYAHTHTPEDAYSSSYATAYGGAIANISGDLTFSGSVNHFSGNSVDAYAHTYAPEDAYSSSYATAYGGAVANISGDLTFTGSANHFGDNSVNATATACNTAYATATAYGGAIANTSGGLTVSGSANHFSGNSVNTYAYAYAPDDTIGSACASAITTAYGGAIAANNSISNLTDVSFSGNNVNAYASARASDYNDVYTSATAVAYGGAIAANNSILNLTNVSFSGNNINATAIARASVSNNAYAYNARATAVAYGGAIAANNSILNLTNVSFSGNNVNAYANAYVSGLAYAARAYNNTAAYGGAVYISNSTLKYVIAENKYIENIDNNTQTGGFIYLDGVSEATFQIDGGLTVGNSSGMDSVAGSATSTIIKTGTGTWTIKSDISRFAGYWNVNEGILKLVRIARSITLDKWTFGVDAELHLSALNDRITMSVDKKIGTIDLGGGSDTINTGGYHLSDGLLRISTLTLTGGGKVSSDIITRTPGAEFDITLDNVTLSSNITGGNAADKITITQTSELSGITTLGNGANTIFASSGTKTTFSNTFSAGNDNDSLTFHQVIFEKSLELGDGANTFTATGEAQFSNIITGSGSDTFSLQNASFSGFVDLGDGTNTITATSASFCNGITGGSGNDSIKMTADSSISGVVALGGGKNYIYNSQNLDFSGSFKLDSDGETHLIIYNGASLTENALTVYANEGAEMISTTLDWNDIAGLDKVRILVSSDATFETFEFTVELYNQTKSFTLNMEEGYFIQFQAQDEDGWSQRLLTDTDAPEQVSGFSMNGTTAIWNDTHDNLGGNGVKQYNIQVASDKNFNSIIGTYTSSDNSYSFASYADGNYFIRIQAEDYTGNKGEWSNVANLLIDTTAPEKPAASADITCVTNGNVTVSATFSNDTVSREYSLDNKSWTSYTSGVTMSANGKVYFRGTDEAGNVSAVTTYEVTNIDKVAPSKLNIRCRLLPHTKLMHGIRRVK